MNFICTFFLALSFVWLACASHAADIRCADSERLCSAAELSGKIEVGDALLVERFFDKQRNLLRLHLVSPGGNVAEAIKIGRMVRKRFLETYATPYQKFGSNENELHCGSIMGGGPPCCLSACALIYFGGAMWFATDRVGLHRPILEELGDYEYGDAQKHGRRAEALVKEYLEEMEIDDRVFAAMMATPPDKITDWRIYPQFLANPDLSILRFPKSINDWLFAKCRRMGDRPRDGCMRDELHKERRRRAKRVGRSAHEYGRSPVAAQYRS